ncbi:Receptor expression-enhancing protein 2 [Coemansia sp. RSA 988]|nr:Receptor expression-enhancing protein 2 [Coemansia sp. RSA 988]
MASSFYANSSMRRTSLRFTLHVHFLLQPVLHVQLYAVVGVGYLYPAYKCFKLLHRGPEAIGTPTSTDEQRDIVKSMLKHWVVMSSFTAVELVTDTFIFWLPLVGMVKVAFIAWLVLPGINGADIIYDKVVEPFLVNNEEQLDSYFRQARAVAHRSTESVSMTVYDRWVGYMQTTIGQLNGSASSHSTATDQQTPVSANEDRAGYSGFTGLLKSVAQNIPQASAAANYLTGTSENGSENNTNQPDARPARSTLVSTLTTWAASLTGPSTGSSDDQRLRDIQSRKTQLQDMISQLESSEKTILVRRPKVAPPSEPQQPGVQTDNSEFEDDAVMVGGLSAESSSGSHSHSEQTSNSKDTDSKKQPPAPPATTASSARRWFW